MSDLFNMPESKSPKLLWIEAMKANGMLTHESDQEDDPWIAIIPMDDHSGTIGEIMAEWSVLYDECDMIGYGQTEIEAMSQCAMRNKIKLWNQP